MSQSVHILATTATATKTTLTAVQNRLLMKDPVVVALPPEKSNIFYEVMVYPDFEAFLETMIEDLCRLRLMYPKTIIFCRKFSDCSTLYLRIRHTMKDFFTEPPNSPDLHIFRLIDMYHSAATVDMRSKIVKSFCTAGGKLRMVICTTAFGLGIDCPDVRRVVHWGPPNDLDSYVQESGRGGRDNILCTATLLYGHVSQYVNSDMKRYAKDEGQCRRISLFSPFIMGDSVRPHKPSCECCDVCRKSCSCHKCKQ